MFCASLRRRPSFAPIIPALVNTASLHGMRASRTPFLPDNPFSDRTESRCDTYDIAIPIPNIADIKHAHRQLRVLLLSPTCLDDATLDETLRRVEHFASLTGGQDLAIIFLLNPPPDTRFMSARLVNNTSIPQTNVKGTLAYVKLQATLFNRQDVPHVPLVPLVKLDGLPALLHRLSRNPSPATQQRAVSSFELLQHCTASPPMTQSTAFVLSDLFNNLADLANTCMKVGNLMDGIDSSGQGTLEEEKLAQLQQAVGPEESAGVVDFWKDEWVIE